LIHTPAVLAELEKLTNESERNAKAYIDSLWAWLERLQALVETSSKVSRHELQLGLQAARILARLYIRGPFGATPPTAFHIDGLDEEGIRSLVGDAT
jgi:hypothetical protein